METLKDPIIYTSLKIFVSLFRPEISIHLSPSHTISYSFFIQIPKDQEFKPQASPTSFRNEDNLGLLDKGSVTWDPTCTLGEQET